MRLFLPSPSLRAFLSFVPTPFSFSFLTASLVPLPLVVQSPLARRSRRCCDSQGFFPLHTFMGGPSKAQGFSDCLSRQPPNPQLPRPEFPPGLTRPRTPTVRAPPRSHPTGSPPWQLLSELNTVLWAQPLTHLCLLFLSPCAPSGQYPVPSASLGDFAPATLCCWGSRKSSSLF